MKKPIFVLAIILYHGIALGADVSMTWDASANATGYKVSMSTDGGKSWGATRDAGTGTTFTWLGAPNTGLVLFRIAAHNSFGEAIRTDAGVWYCGDWKEPVQPKGVGIE